MSRTAFLSLVLCLLTPLASRAVGPDSEPTTRLVKVTTYEERLQLVRKQRDALAALEEEISQKRDEFWARAARKDKPVLEAVTRLEKGLLDNLDYEKALALFLVNREAARAALRQERMEEHEKKLAIEARVLDASLDLHCLMASFYREHPAPRIELLYELARIEPTWVKCSNVYRMELDKLRNETMTLQLQVRSQKLKKK